MRDFGPRQIQRFRRIFQREKGVRVGQRSEVASGNLFDGGPSLSQRRLNRGSHVLGRKRGPTDVKGGI